MLTAESAAADCLFSFKVMTAERWRLRSSLIFARFTTDLTVMSVMSWKHYPMILSKNMERWRLNFRTSAPSLHGSSWFLTVLHGIWLDDEAPAHQAMDSPRPAEQPKSSKKAMASSELAGALNRPFPRVMVTALILYRSSTPEAPHGCSSLQALSLSCFCRFWMVLPCCWRMTNNMNTSPGFFKI